MYRDKYRQRKRPSDTRFWESANHLKEWKLTSAVHALAYINIEAFNFIVREIRGGTSLELIMSRLWQNYAPDLQKMRSYGFGTLSPNSLLTCKRQLENGTFPDIQADIKRRQKQTQELRQRDEQIDSTYQERIKPVEDRVGIPTKIGCELITRSFRLRQQCLILNRPLHLSDQ